MEYLAEYKNALEENATPNIKDLLFMHNNEQRGQAEKDGFA